MWEKILSKVITQVLNRVLNFIVDEWKSWRRRSAKKDTLEKIEESMEGARSDDLDERLESNKKSEDVWGAFT